MRSANFDEQAMEEKIKDNIEKAGFTIETMTQSLFQELKQHGDQARMHEARCSELIDQINYIMEKYGGLNEKD